MDPESRSLSYQFVQHSATPDTVLLARGAAANVWLLARTETRPSGSEESPSSVMPKYVSKCMRLSPDVIISYRHGRKVQSEGLNRQEEYYHLGTTRDPWPQGLRAYDIIIGAVQGLRYLHQLTPPIVHGNLNPGNIYIVSNREIKLGGFSLALLTEEFSTLAPTISLSGYCRWMSPELFHDRGEGEEGVERTTASDIWAFGCTMYEIISRMVPYSLHVHDAEVVGKIMSGVKPGITGDIPPEAELSHLWTTIEDCWAAPPENRPGASRLLGKVRLFFAFDLHRDLTKAN
ncbi:Serine/threonine-protein kinase [Ceratobasidium sp. AG-Ba]|nr:Serine/threonine-protein kinase [Ceratobasidium sp. AG-Ba]